MKRRYFLEKTAIGAAMSTLPIPLLALKSDKGCSDSSNDAVVNWEDEFKKCKLDIVYFIEKYLKPSHAWPIPGIRLWNEWGAGVGSESTITCGRSIVFSAMSLAMHRALFWGERVACVVSEGMVRPYVVMFDIYYTLPEQLQSKFDGCMGEIKFIRDEEIEVRGQYTLKVWDGRIKDKTYRWFDTIILTDEYPIFPAVLTNTRLKENVSIVWLK